MSLTKIIVIVIISGIILFASLLVYALWPKIRDISDQKRLTRFVNTPLIIRTAAFIYKSDKGSYRFSEHVMSQMDQYESEKKYDLPVGSVITIQKIKTYRNDAGSGYTDVFALGEFITLKGEKIEFEYDWGGIDPPLYKTEVPDLPLAPWQNITDSTINIEK